MHRQRPAGGRLTLPIGVSLVLHAGALALMAGFRPPSPPPQPPMYRVDLVAAPAGPRQAGIVAPQPETPPAEPVPVPQRARASPRDMPLPDPPPARRQPPAPAMPTPAPTTPQPRTPAADAPVAGGGPVGGRGTDVATVRTEGIEFPFPGYLENIVRQIAIRFDPPRGASVRAEVMFLVRRDGSISNFRFLTRSGNFAFDQDAQGAVEQAGSVRAFGPLPDGFSDDVLPVIFSFDPRVIR